MNNWMKALALLGGDDQFEQDVKHVYESAAHARAMGEEAHVEGIWMPKGVITVTFTDGSMPLETRIMDRGESRRLAFLELMRYNNPDIELTDREKVLRDALNDSLQETVRVSPDIAQFTMKQILGNVLLDSAGVAVFEGTVEGVSIATGFYHDLRQLGT